MAASEGGLNRLYLADISQTEKQSELHCHNLGRCFPAKTLQREYKYRPERWMVLHVTSVSLANFVVCLCSARIN